MSPERALELAAQWRERAALLTLHARRLRVKGWTFDAEDAEQAATDYRRAAAELEAQWPA